MSRPSLLIVDDLLANIQVLGRALENDYDIAFATSGEQALELARAVPPELILLDVMMPGLDGFETCRQLKADPACRDIPVIFVTARSDIQDQSRGFELGAVDYIVKPYEIPLVRARIQAHVRLRRGEQEVRENEARLRAIFDSLPIGVLLADRDGQIVDCNSAAPDLLGIDREALLGRDIADARWPVRRPDGSPMPPAEFPGSRALREGRAIHDVELEIARDGGGLWLSVSATPLEHPRFGLIIACSDVSARKQAEEKLHLAAKVFSHAREGIMIADGAGRIVEVNDTFCRITGYQRAEVLGGKPSLLRSGRHGPEFYEALWRDLLDKGYWHGEVWNRRKNGEVYPEMLTISAVRDGEGRPRHFVALFSDITAQKEHERQLERIAHYDALTGLPNRVLLADRMRLAMAQAQRRGTRLAVVYLDLDAFKAINDTHGHDIGDDLLLHLATRMKDALREGDTLARMGGDEFVAVLVDLPDTSACTPVLERLLTAAAQPVRLPDRQPGTPDYPLQVSASLGVSFYPQGEEVDPDQLLRQADQAMYQAKLAGKNRYHLFDAERDRDARGLHESLERIRRALAEREFVLYYQPKVNLRQGRVVGAEALIRWQHPERGLLAPAAFLPGIEEHPLAIQVGEWVIDTALAQMAAWRAEGLDLPVSVNIGARQLQQPEFLDRLRASLAAQPTVPPRYLQLEVLETSALEDIALVSRVMHACRELGVSFALDDFGTGYSSLTYLKRLPAALLKIDQSFVRDMLDDPEDLAILEGVLGLANAFRRQAMAEGVESVEHGVMLLRLGCELAQGYAIARPMPALALSDWARDWRPDPAWRDRGAISRDHLSVLYATVEHRAWVRALEAYLEGERLEPPPQDTHHCRFGEWLEHEAGHRLGRDPRMAEIRALHQEIHAHAEQLLTLRREARQDDVRSGLVLLWQTRDRLLERLHAFLD